jgi:hypothetical protein
VLLGLYVILTECFINNYRCPGGGGGSLYHFISNWTLYFLLFHVYVNNHPEIIYHCFIIMFLTMYDNAVYTSEQLLRSPVIVDL